MWLILLSCSPIRVTYVTRAAHVLIIRLELLSRGNFLADRSVASSLEDVVGATTRCGNNIGL